jgi:UDP-4-amino-4-deoxy-L-arabinose-oxoglutarate aminotransferase
MLPSNIAIIEDCAHAVESRLDGYAPGTYGDVALYSFFQSKNLTTGEGGAVTTNDDRLRDAIKLSYRYGVNLSGHARHHMDQFVPADAVTMGMKANMPDILALLLEPQLPKVEQRLARRREIYDRYLRELGNMPLRFPAAVGGTHAHHMFPIGVDPSIRDKVITYMFGKGFKTTVHYKSVPMTEIYQQRRSHKPSDHPNAYAWGESTLSLPVFPGLTDAEQSYVIDLLKSALDGSSFDESL